MIELSELSLWHQEGDKKHFVFEKESIVIPTDKKVGLLAENGQGKSVFLDCLTGLRRPDEGALRTTRRWISVLGKFPLLEAGLTLAETVKYICLISGEPRAHRDILESVLALGELDRFQHRVVRNLSPGLNQRFKFALSLALGEGFYLLDGKGSFGDDKYKKRSNELVEKLLLEDSYIFATTIPYQVKKYCDAMLLIKGGKLLYYTDVEKGVEHFEA